VAVVSSIVLVFAPLMTWWRVDVSGTYTFSESGRWFTAGTYVQIAGVSSVLLWALFSVRSMGAAGRYLALTLAAVAILTFAYLINFLTDTSHLDALFSKSINDPVPVDGMHITPGIGLVLALLADLVLAAISVLETVRAQPS
jgi:hypothetical protein